MVNWPKVSIVIPTFNSAKTLEPCLKSISNLNYPSKIETVIVDDNSKDGTIEIAKKFNAKIIINKKREGVSESRNIGIKASKSEIIAFTDSDCIVSKGWLMELVPYLYLGYVAVGGEIIAYEKKGLFEKYEGSFSPVLWKNKVRVNNEKRIGNEVPTCNMITKKANLVKAGYFDKEINVGEDVDLSFKLMDLGSVIRTDEGRVKHIFTNSASRFFRKKIAYSIVEPTLNEKYKENTSPKLNRKSPRSIIYRIMHQIAVNMPFLSYYSLS